MYQRTAQHHNLRFLLICLVLFACGGYLRVRSGWLVLPGQAPGQAPGLAAAPAAARPAARAVTPTPRPPRATALPAGQPLPAFTSPLSPTLAASAAGQPIPATATEMPAVDLTQIPVEPGELVQRFYTLVNKGKFEEAYGLILEASFAESGRLQYRLVGLASLAEVQSELGAAFGQKGEMIKIINMGVQATLPLPPEEQDPGQRPELYALDYLPQGLQALAVYEVRLAGALIEVCSPWSWEKSVLVVRLSDGSYRVLQARHPPGRIERYQDYFANENFYEGSQIARGEA